MQYLSTVLFFFSFLIIVDSWEKLKKVIFVACIGAGFYAVYVILRGVVTGGRIQFGTMFDSND
jgi:hypothetical protein